MVLNDSHIMHAMLPWVRSARKAECHCEVLFHTDYDEQFVSILFSYHQGKIHTRIERLLRGLLCVSPALFCCPFKVK